MILLVARILYQTVGQVVKSELKKLVEWTRGWLILVTILTVDWTYWGKPPENSVKMAGTKPSFKNYPQNKKKRLIPIQLKISISNYRLKVKLAKLVQVRR